MFGHSRPVDYHENERGCPEPFFCEGGKQNPNGEGHDVTIPFADVLQISMVSAPPMASIRRIHTLLSK
jgi:hypothetical protein